MVFMIREEFVTRLLEASQTLHGKLVASPLWELLKSEPTIVTWINALRDVESQVNQKKLEAPGPVGQ